jgi:predicted RNA-binding protein associated with RNAse of E/G family
MFDDIHDAGCAASDYRLTHVVEIAAVYDRGRINKSQSVKTHRASQTPQQRREQALKGHRKRKGLLSTNQSGYKGVSWNSKSKRWYVTVMIDGKKKRLGSYVDVHEAGRVIEAFRENEAIENLDHA